MCAQMTFDDEFNSLNLWNGSSGTWQPVYPWSPNGYEASDGTSWLVNPNWGPTSSSDADPYSVNNGVLSLNLMPTPSDVSSSAVNNAPFLSGQIESQPSFSQTYGYFEMRAQLPAAPGLLSAFWLVPESGAWPPELDVAEIVSNSPTTLVNTAHTGPNNSANPMWSNIPNSSQGFHTYAVDWEPDTITWYFDGKQVAQEATPSDMHQPMYIIAGMGAGTSGSWEGAPTSGETAQMKIDYIRAYSSNPYVNGATNPDWNNTSGPSSSPPASASSPAASGTGSSPSAGITPSPTPSPDNTVITAAGGGSITDANGNVWSIVNGEVAVNGTPDGQSANVTELAYEKGLIWQENADDMWWSKSKPSDTWSPTYGTATSPVPATSTQSSSSSTTPPSESITVTDNSSGQSSVIDATTTGTSQTAGATINLTAPGVAAVTLGSVPDTMQFVGMSSIDLTAGSAASTVSADGGKNSFTAGSGALTVTGGSGADSYTYNAGDAELTVTDFSASKGDTLTVSQSLQSSVQESGDGKGGTMLTFGTGGGIDLQGVGSFDTSQIHFA